MRGDIKGQNYTNHVCRKLTFWWFPELGPKSPMGKAPFRARSTLNVPIEGHWEQKGDIVHKPGLRWPFAAECKKHEQWELEGLFHVPKWKPWEWWDQAVAQAAASRDKVAPILFFSRNRRPDYVMLPESAATRMQLGTFAHDPVFVFARNDVVLTLCLLDDLVRVPRKNLEAVEMEIASG